MKLVARSLVFILAVLAACSGDRPTAPRAEPVPHRLEAHGQVRVDDYYWLRDRDDPAVIAHLEAENAYADAVMSGTEALQATLVREFSTRIPQTDTSPPVRDHGWLYYHRTEAGRDYPVYCRAADRPGAGEQVLLDVNAVAEGHDFCSAGRIRVSPESDVMAYAVDTVGRRKYVLRFVDLTTGRGLADEIRDVTGEAVWAGDGATLYYSRQDPATLRWFQVWRHELGSDPAADVLVYQEDDPTFNVEISKTRSGRFIVIESIHTLATEVRAVDADDATGAPMLVIPRERGVEAHLDHLGDRFLIRTNLDAPNFRLVSTPVTEPGREHWRDVVSHRDDVLLEDVDVFRDHLVLTERAGGNRRLVVLDLRDGSAHDIPLDDEPCDVWVDDNRELDTEVLRYGTSSLTTPESLFDYDMTSRERVMVWRQDVAGGYHPDDYVAERLMVPARDGAEVPLSVVRRRGLPLDGTSPLLLTGYGAYGSSSDPDFDPEVVSLLERGFSFAIAHVRGGQEMGRQWYEDGRMMHKMNTFNDFIDCARFLVDRGYTSPDRLAARGRSAGGLLMGAVANLEPELFAVIVAEVPFVDVVTTMLDDSIPLTTAEFDEWGDPDEPDEYDYLLSYSPYDRVEAKAYPAMMVTAGLHDSQVQYWEPAKWVARLRALKTDERPLILRTMMAAGHGGASGRTDGYRDRAEEFAFIIENVAGVD